MKFFHTSYTSKMLLFCITFIVLFIFALGPQTARCQTVNAAANCPLCLLPGEGQTDRRGYTSIGSSVYADDGTTYNQIGDSVYRTPNSSFSSNATIRQNGSAGYTVSHGNELDVYTRIGSSIYGTDGTTIRQYDNGATQITDKAGRLTICTPIGNGMYCN